MKSKLTIALLLALAAPAAFAADGDWRWTVGVHNVNPKSDNGSLAAGALDVEVDGAWRPTFTVERMFGDNWGVEVLASLPFKHDVNLNGAFAGEATHLPPTVSLQYHFAPEAKVSPFIGAGINYTVFYNEDSAGPIAGTDLSLDNSFGLAFHGGLDFNLENNWFVGVDVRWMDIDSDVRVDGDDVGTVNIDPTVFGFYVGRKF